MGAIGHTDNKAFQGEKIKSNHSAAQRAGLALSKRPPTVYRSYIFALIKYFFDPMKKSLVLRAIFSFFRIVFLYCFFIESSLILNRKCSF